MKYISRRMKKERFLIILSLLLLCVGVFCIGKAYVSSGEELEKSLSQWNLGARPSFQYDGVRYYFREKSVSPKLINEDIFRVSQLKKEHAPSPNNPELLGSSIWGLPNNSDVLYLKKGGSRYFLFMSAPAWRNWIYLDNSFFLYEGHVPNNVSGSLEDRTHLPDTFISLGAVSFDEADRDRMPHKDMTTNDPWLKGHQVYIDSENKNEVYVEMVNDGSLALTYIRYVKTDPKGIFDLD